ncbi:MAG: exosortase C-terminal domain/associated protein EpsI, partial [Steroidobacteraceae bacterium]
RARLDAVPVRAAPQALAAVVLLSAAWLVFWRAGIQDLHLVALPMLIFSALFAVLGWRAARLLVFPIGFLYFALPFWGDLVDVLQRLSVKATGVLIWLTGMPAYMHGNYIHVPAGTLEIAGGCSGLHFLIVGLALAGLYGELLEGSLRRRLGWLALMAAISLLANWLRIFVIAVAAYATDMRTFLITVDHYWFGWGVFAAGFAGFLWIAERAPLGSSGPPGAPDAPVAAPSATRVNATSCAAALICMGALPVLVYAGVLLRARPAATVAIEWPAGRGPWRGPEAVDPGHWKPEFHQASAADLRRYVSASGRSVELYAVVYRRQSQGAKLVAYNNSALGDPDSRRLLAADVVHSRSGPWREAIIVEPGGEKSIIWSRFQIGERTFVVPLASQLWYGISALAADPLSSLLAIRAVCTSGCEAARALLESSAAAIAPQLRLSTGRDEDPAS